MACSWGPSPSTRQVPGSSPGLRATCAFLHPPFLPPSGDSVFRTFPTKPTKVLGLLYTTGWVYYKIPNTIKSYKISKTRAIALPYKACLSKQHPWRAAGHGDPLLACGTSRARAPAPAGMLRTLFFSTLSSFLPFSHLPHQTHESVRVIVV